MIDADRKRRKKRIAEIATEIVSNQMEKGEIEQSEEALQKAMPAAVKLAKEAYDAPEDFFSTNRKTSFLRRSPNRKGSGGFLNA